MRSACFRVSTLGMFNYHRSPMGPGLVRVLGMPQVLVAGALVGVGVRSTLLLLKLALASPASVTRSRLREDVWWDATGTDGGVRVQVSRIRTTLGSESIVRWPDGYTLGPGIVIDVERFEVLCMAARERALSVEQRIAAYDEALELWRGNAFLGLDHVPWLADEATRLDELREQAIDERFVLRALVEAPARLIPDLRAAVAHHPTRERRVGLLATALFCDGRQTDALESIRRLRRKLVDGYGLSPGPAIDEVELRILRQDPTLLDRPAIGGASNDGVTEGKLRAARTLIDNGLLGRGIAIIDEVSAVALAQHDHRTYAEALLVRAAALQRADDATADPSPMIDQAQTIARQLRDGVLLAKCAMARLGKGIPLDSEHVLIELTEPLALLPTSSPHRLDLLCFASVVVAFTGDTSAGAQLIEAARRSFERIGSPRSEAVWLTTKSILGAVRGDDREETAANATRAYALAAELDDAALRVVAAQAMLRSKYAVGDLATIDELLPGLLRDSTDANLPFGIVRVSLCRTMNALARGRLDLVPALLEQVAADVARLRTYAGAGALLSQQNLFRLEMGLDDEIAAVAQLLLTGGPSVWHAVHAVCGMADADDVMAVADDVPSDDLLMPFVAFAAVTAARDHHAALGSWCLERLEPMGDATIVVGLGTNVLGFAAHFAALSHEATGDFERARGSYEQSRRLADDVGARLWWAYSSVGLASVLTASADNHAQRTAIELLAEVDEVAAASGSVRLARLSSDVRERMRETTN